MANKRKDDLRKKVQSLRAKGMTQEAVAKQLGISGPLVAYYSKPVVIK